MAQWIVEGFENGLVRLEFRDWLLDFPRHMLPEVKVGDVLTLEQQGEWFRFVVDQETTDRLMQEARQALADLNDNAPEGDIKI